MRSATLAFLARANQCDLVHLRRRGRPLTLSCAAAVLGFCFTVAWRSQPPTPNDPTAAPASPAKADPAAERTIWDSMQGILVLRGDFEAKNPGWSGNVRQKGEMLAGQIGSVDPEKLRPARRIIQREYKGWALLMVARTFGAEEEEPDAAQQRIQYATRAVAEFDAALGMMADIEKRVAEGRGDKDAEAVYKWMMGESADLDRTRYLKAVALAVIARADGKSPKSEVLKMLDSVSPAYRHSNPPDDNPDLRWARRVTLTINAVREGTAAPAPSATLTLWNAQRTIEQEGVPFPGGRAQLQVLPGRYFLSAVGGVQRWPIEVHEPATTITVSVSASGELKGFPSQAPMDPDGTPMTPQLWIGLVFAAVLVVFLMITFFFVTSREAPIPQAAYNSLHFLTALCASFAGALLAGEALVRWEQQLAGGAKVFFSATAGFALFFLVWFKYPPSVRRKRVRRPGATPGHHPP